MIMKNELPVIETDEKHASKNKGGVGRISRLFQKKPKKKLDSQLSDPSLSKQETCHSNASIASSQTSNNHMSETTDRSSYISVQQQGNTPYYNSMNDTASISSKLTRNLSIRSTQSMTLQQMVLQQRNLLKDLDLQKAMYNSDVTHLNEQLQKTQEKIKQRSHDMDLLENNYQAHLRSVRSSDDDPTSIGKKLLGLRERIHGLASELVPHAEPLTSEKLSTLWINLGPSIQQLGTPLPPHRILMLTEKFMMDVLVQNLNLHYFPGLSCGPELTQLQQWFEQNDSSSHFSTRLQQEVTLLVAQNNQKAGEEVQEIWQKCADKNWTHLYKGLQKAYPTYLAKKTTDQKVIDEQTQANAIAYGKKLRELVDYSMSLGSAIKGQEVSITAVDVREGVQPIDCSLMDDVDGQTCGTVGFCISPPFVMRAAKGYEPLIKGKVLCFQQNEPSIPKK